MNIDQVEPADTLGRRLDRAARQAVARRMPKLAWLRNLQPVLDRVSRASQFQGRFERQEAGIAPVSLGVPLPFHVTSSVERVTGPGAAAVRVHDGSAADQVAAAHDADAVAVGPDVFFRQGQFRPESPEGFGLLVHETLHVIEAMQPGASWRRATGMSRAQEEQRAARAESAAIALHSPARVHRAPVVATPIPVAATPPVSNTPARSHVMRAETGRAMDAAPAQYPNPSLDLEKLRRDIQRDLLRQLRTDFERGA